MIKRKLFDSYKEKITISEVKESELPIITKLYKDNFNPNYTLTDIKRLYKEANNSFYGCYSNGKMVAVVRVRMDKKEFFKNDKVAYDLIDTKYAAFIGDVISVKKGCGKILINFVIDKVVIDNKSVLFIVARNEALSGYYNSLGFINVHTGDSRNLLIYDYQHR